MRGFCTSATNPENGTVSYYYNADNTLQYKHDAKGQDTVYTYDSQKRLTMTQQKYPLRPGEFRVGMLVHRGLSPGTATFPLSAEISRPDPA